MVTPVLVIMLISNFMEEYSHARGGCVTRYVITYIYATSFGTHLTLADTSYAAVLRRGLPQRRNVTRVVVN